MAIATSSQEPGEAAEEAEAEDDRPERQEIRLALVMNGGVSLAIWMGGVTVEINRLINGDPVYADILGLLKSVVRVDVIAGASAGGINGAVLAAMISHENDRETELASLRRIWLEDGGFGVLFRPPLQNNPPSLLKGDEFFLPELRSVFKELTDGPLTSADEFPIRLTLTTTLLKPVHRGFADDFGSLISDADHRGEFTFRRGKDLIDHFDTGRDQAVADRLALASRSTASFPVAFEPSYVPVGISPEEQERDPGRPDMKGYVNFSSSRFCADGGALVNKPFRPAIRGIFSQPAGDEEVRRVLAYVVPDPEALGSDLPQLRTEEQSVVKVALAAGVTLPRAESVSRELEDIGEHNRKVHAQRLLREHLLAPEGDGASTNLEGMAARLFPAFQTLRAQRIVDRLTTGADPFETGFDGLGSAPWDTVELRQLLVGDPDPWLPSEWDVEEPLFRTPWTWGNETIESMGGIALDLVNAGFRLAAADERPSLGEKRMQIHERLRELRLSCLRPEVEFWSRQAEVTQAYWRRRADPSSGLTTDRWPRESFETWRSDASDTSWTEGGFLGPDPAAIAKGITEEVVGAVPILLDVSRRSEAEAAGRRLAGMARVLSVEHAADQIEETGRRLLGQAMIQLVTSAGKPEPDQLVELLEISSTAPNGFDHRERGDEKVAGRQLGHFGAFYKRSWRANDWMWGRLDGATRLTQVIVDPTRLARLGLSAHDAFERLKEIALGPEGTDSYDVLADGSGRGWDDDGARSELAFLDRPSPQPPKTLPVCARAVARRIQLRILQEELPEVADAVEIDGSDGVRTAESAAGFLRAVRQAKQEEARDGVWIGPRDASRLLARCRVGEERIVAEAGSDLFTSTITTAAALGVSTLAGSRSGLPSIGRTIVGIMRTPILLLWFLARNAVSRSRTGFAILVLLLAVGGALVAVSALADVAVPGLLGVLGTLLLVGGAAVGLLRSGTRGVLVILLALTIVVLFLWLPSVIVQSLIEADATGVASWVRQLVPTVSIVVGLVLGGVILGLAQASTSEEQRGLPGRGGRDARRDRS
jgi:patatin-related protein